MKEIDIKGVYTNTQDGLLQVIDIRGETTCIITDGIFNLEFASQYVRDGNLLSVQTDKSDLLFNIINSDTLIGEGFAEGIYVKEN